jgi:gluconate 2-dehydrogenase gamma chain
MMAKAAVASQFPGFSRWVFAGQHQHSAETPSARKPANYQPQSFTPAEYQTIEILTELIIPKDESPGAQEAGVVEFIDFMAAHGEEDLRPMHDGLRWLAGTSQKRYGDAFAKLQQDQQTSLMESVADRTRAAKDDPRGYAFFDLIRRYTVMGYYTSRIGLEELDYPGLRLYTQSPECPHKDDPEHKHLPPPRF